MSVPLRLFGSVSLIVTGSCLLEFDPALLESIEGCDGCTDGVQCLAGDSNTACGRNGDACEVCAAPKDGCFERRCVIAHAVLVLAVGYVNSAAVDKNGILFVWGDNQYGQLGLPSESMLDSPTKLGTGYARVALGGTNGTHMCATDEQGQLLCWGSNGDGQTGTGLGTEPNTPTRVGVASDWNDIALSKASTCGIRAPGALWCWGWNESERLGLVDISTTGTPLRVGDLTDWRQVSLGEAHGCAIRTDDSLHCWGSNSAGQLGRQGASAPPAPVEVTATSWQQVDAGDEHTCGIRLDGSLWCWGQGDAGQLGLPASANVPTRVGEALWQDVSAGARHSCGVDQEGALYCWGSNDEGQLGADVGASSTPLRVGVESDWFDVEAGSSHTCASRLDGALFCFGGNGHGELGLGNLSSGTNVPTLTVVAD